MLGVNLSANHPKYWPGSIEGKPGPSERSGVRQCRKPSVNYYVGESVVPVNPFCRYFSLSLRFTR